MRLNVLAVNLKQSNFVSLFVVYILISVFSVVYSENVTSNAINNNVRPMAVAVSTKMVATKNSTQSSASLASAGVINKTFAFTNDAGATSTITIKNNSSTTITTIISTTTVQPSLVAATVKSSQVHQKERPQQKSTPSQKLQQQQRHEKQQQRAKWPSTKGIRPIHGNRLFFDFCLLFCFFFPPFLFSIHKSFGSSLFHFLFIFCSFVWCFSLFCDIFAPYFVHIHMPTQT